MLAEISTQRSESGWFRTADVEALFEAFRIQPPAISGNLSNLRKAGYLYARGAGRSNQWSLTPEGRERIRVIVREIDYASLVAEEVGSPGAEFLHALHTVLGPTFAPAKYAPGITRLHAKYPFEQNVFCMTRFPREGEALPDPIASAVEVLRRVGEEHGMALHVAWGRQLDDDLFTNVGAYMWGCQYGIGLLEDRVDDGLNYNVIAELGSMLMTGRRCALLKDRTAPELPSDFVGQLYKPVDLDDLASLGAEIHRWLKEDLGLGPCPECPRS